MVDLFRGRKWDLVGRRNIWFALSLLVILTGLVFWRVRGLNYGIDFTGGGLVAYQFAEPIEPGADTTTLARAREALETAEVDGLVQIAGTATEKNQLLVRTRVVAEPGKSAADILGEQRGSLLESLSTTFVGIEEVESQLVTPVVSQELIRNAIWAVAWGCVFILLWIRIRYFDFKWAGSALLALAHDMLVLVGVFAITQREINSPFVAAALTVVGYSVHDTIVLFDRIRENLRLRKGDTFAETANISLLETMARSVNTVLTVLLVLISVYLLGGASLRDFTFALIVGMIAGGYSSIFTACQVLVVLKNREEAALTRKRAAKGQVAKPRARVRPAVSRPAPVRGPVAAKSGEELAGEGEAAGAEVSAKAEPRESGSPRAARKKLRAERKRKKRF